MTSNSKLMTQKKQHKTLTEKKLVPPQKKLVENADLDKPILTK